MIGSSEERIRNNNAMYEEQYRMQQRQLEEQLNRSGVPMGPSHPLEMDSRNPQAYPDNRIGASAPRMHRQSQNQRNISANRRQASDYGVQASQNLPMEEQ